MTSATSPDLLSPHKNRAASLWRTRVGPFSSITPLGAFLGLSLVIVPPYGNQPNRIRPRRCTGEVLVGCLACVLARPARNPTTKLPRDTCCGGSTQPYRS